MNGSTTLAVSRALLRLLIVLNWAMCVGIAAMLITSLVAPDFLFSALGMRPGNAWMVQGARLLMVLGICAAPLTHIILSRLLAIVHTVHEGDPFVAVNAARLQASAWALLGLELLHLAIGAIAASVSSAEEPLDIDWTFSPSSWLAVLLLFVLARVFAHGAAMRADLEGTV